MAFASGLSPEGSQAVWVGLAWRNLDNSCGSHPSRSVARIIETAARVGYSYGSGRDWRSPTSGAYGD